MFEVAYYYRHVTAHKITAIHKFVAGTPGKRKDYRERRTVRARLCFFSPLNRTLLHQGGAKTFSCHPFLFLLLGHLSTWVTVPIVYIPMGISCCFYLSFSLILNFQWENCCALCLLLCDFWIISVSWQQRTKINLKTWKQDHFHLHTLA